MNKRNSLTINNNLNNLNSNNNNNKNIPSLEILCLDYVLSKIDLFDIDKLLINGIKEKLLQRITTLYKNKFTLKSVSPPLNTIQRVEQLIDFENTSHLDFSSILNFNSLNSNHFQFLQKCTGIRSFTISGVPTLTPDKVLPFLQLFGKSLLRLDLSRCPRLNDSIIHYVSFYCPNLEYFNLEECIGISGAIFQRASNYINLVLNNNSSTKINNNNLNNNNNNSNNNLNNTNNNSNNNSNNNLNNNLNNNKSLFMNKMISLIELNLSGCKSILPRNLYSLKTVFQNLKIFSLSKVFLSDEDGSLLVQTLPSTLEVLDLSFNPIGKNTIRALLPNSKNWTSFHLKSLSLGYCRCINSNDLAYVVTGLYKSLEYLSIPGLFQLDNSFLEILLSSPYYNNNNSNSNNNNNNNNNRKSGILALKTLDISYCSQFLSSSTLLKINQNYDRDCPAPQCGGYWLTRVNTGQSPIYVSSISLDPSIINYNISLITLALTDDLLLGGLILSYPKFQYFQVWNATRLIYNNGGDRYFNIPNYKREFQYITISNSKTNVASIVDRNVNNSNKFYPYLAETINLSFQFKLLNYKEMYSKAINNLDIGWLNNQITNSKTINYGYMDPNSNEFQITKIFIDIPLTGNSNPIEKCKEKLKKINYQYYYYDNYSNDFYNENNCTDKEIPTYHRDNSKCIFFSGCVYNDSLDFENNCPFENIKCPHGYILSSIKTKPYGCNHYFCDVNFLS